MISSFHDASMTNSKKKDKDGQPIKKPKCVVEYNKYMGSVDKLDQMNKYYPCTRQTVKWTKKFVLYLIELSIVNAHILYQKNVKKVKLLEFRLLLIDGIIQGAEQPARFVGWCVIVMTQYNLQQEHQWLTRQIDCLVG